MNNEVVYTTAGLTTFNTVHRCGTVYRVYTLDQLRFALYQAHNPLILGGGTNTLFAADIARDIIVVALKGFSIIKEDDESALVRVGAGELWHELVCWAIDKDLGGIENLSLIPGLTGAAPMQNIGAYGVEIKDVLVDVEVFDIHNGVKDVIPAEDCGLSYRDSHFKGLWKNRYVILAITIRLMKKGYHNIKTEYGDIRKELSVMHVEKPGIRDVSAAVIAIRRRKLPDPLQLPNAGSFFKNPIIDKDLGTRIKESHPSAPVYPVDADHVKIAAGWLIDQAGWRGFKDGNVGSHQDQALVIVNYGVDNGAEITHYARRIKVDVFSKFGIMLEEEVNIVG